MATADDDRRSKELTPFLNLSLPEVATSLCFVGVGDRGSQSLQSSYRIETNLDGSDSDSSDELTFRTSSFAKKSTLALQYQQRQELLHERLLMTCHPSGQVRIWNCLQQQCISGIDSRGGAGMAVKRLYDPSLFLYQTRDPSGVVSVHSLARSGSTPSVVRNYETYSATFCQAAPCEGDSHLLALPSSQENVATVMDGRVREPIFSTSPLTDHGMVTSLAISISGTANRPILACGMESGSVYFHDFGSGKMISQGDIKLTMDPILALDMVPAASFEEKGDEISSVLAAAGMAGDAVEVADMPTWEQGRVALIKASTNTKISSEWNIRTRARLSTCKIDNESSGGKPGVSICRFRPGDGRLVAVGGWDNRVRLFERTRGKPLAILRGHEGSVNALDWAHDAANSGLLATAGANDSTVSFWRCFNKK